MTARRSAVLLVHGLGGTEHSMAPLAHALAARGFSATALTLPGHGTSPDDLATVGWRHWADAVAAYIARADHGDGVVVVGQSMGGALALHAAADPANHVSGVVAINTPVPDPDAIDGIEWRISRGHHHLDATVEEGEQGYSTVPMTSVLAMAEGLLQIDLAAVSAPVTVVNGALDDAVDPASGELLVAALTGVGASGVRRVVLHDTGHVATFGPQVDAIADEVGRLVGPTAAD